MPIRAKSENTSHAEIAMDALGNPVRRDILRQLNVAPKAVVDIAKEYPISRPAVSKHLKILESSGMIVGKAAGNRIIYSLEPQGFREARDWLDNFWKDGLARFAILADNTEEPR